MTLNDELIEPVESSKISDSIKKGFENCQGYLALFDCINVYFMLQHELVTDSFDT